MTLGQLLFFLIVPIGGLAMGYVAMRLSQREAARFDDKRNHAH